MFVLIICFSLIFYGPSCSILICSILIWWCCAFCVELKYLFDWYVLWFIFHVCCLYWFYLFVVCLSVCVCVCVYGPCCLILNKWMNELNTSTDANEILEKKFRVAQMTYQPEILHTHRAIIRTIWPYRFLVSHTSPQKWAPLSAVLFGLQPMAWLHANKSCAANESPICLVVSQIFTFRWGACQLSYQV